MRGLTVNLKRLRYYEGSFFLIGWLLIFLWGADFPPPIGFLWLLPLLLVLTILQDRQLRFLAQRIKRQPTFFKNFLFFLLGSFVLALLTASLQTASFAPRLIWILVVTSVGSLYGSLFWLINRWIIPKLP
ncbi:MAG: hypothetical protein E6540_02035 [Enterococcus sp.]|nr:hypothetical protein [Enterococcus sp.]